MPSLRALLVVLALPACGARTPLDGSQATSGGGVVVLPDGGVVLPDGGSTHPRVCPSWSAVHPAVQVSTGAGPFEVQDALPNASGVLVGYGPTVWPPPDSTWRVRRVSYDGTQLGTANAVLTRDASKLGWTRSSLAAGFGHSAATAWDEIQGMLFVPMDDSGAATTAPLRTPGDTARELLATASGFTVLRSPYEMPKTPVSLATLDAAGHVTGARELIPKSESLDSVARMAFGDGSFVLTFWAEDTCPGCRNLYVQHLSETGDALAPRSLLHAVGPMGPLPVAVAPSSAGLLAAWYELVGTRLFVTTAAFDRDGQPLGPPARLMEPTPPNTAAIALATAPGGDLLFAFVQTGSGADTKLFVQSLTADGLAESPPVLVASPTVGLNDQAVMVVASSMGAMVIYEDDSPNTEAQVFAVPLKCAL